MPQWKGIGFINNNLRFFGNCSCSNHLFKTLRSSLAGLNDSFDSCETILDEATLEL